MNYDSINNKWNHVAYSQSFDFFMLLFKDVLLDRY